MATPPPAVTDLRQGLSLALEEAVRPVRAGTGPFGILFSGGVDSALLAWELRDRPEITLVTVGREESADLQRGEAGARLLGLPWEGLRIGPEEVREAEAQFREDLKGVTSVSRAVLLSLALAIELSSPPRLICGQGVDELFLGYAHYRGLDVERAEQRVREDLDRLHVTDWPTTERIARRCGKQIVAPYLAPVFEASAQKIPIGLRLPRDVPKRFFREWAVERGLPPELADRPKKAFQYGSGVDALLRSLERTGP